MAIHKGILPPTINHRRPDEECDLDYVPNVMRKVDIEHAMTNSFGFGGTNASLILSRYRN
jgi:3-oxoacyl-[acyl-carrier-protein] synthase II